MGLFNLLFGSTESLAIEIEADDKMIINMWRDYTKTIPSKKSIIEKSDDDLLKNIKHLKKLLQLEMNDIENEERKDKELIKDLKSLSHENKIRKIQRLEQCLGYAETKYEYVHKLLHELHLILKNEINIVKTLILTQKNSKELITQIKLQFELEKEIIKRIENVGTFQKIFIALVRGEHIIKVMSSKEKRLLSKMKKGFGKIVNEEKTKGVTVEWALQVYNGVENFIRDKEAFALKGYDFHPDVGREFVNSSDFLELAKESIEDCRKKTISNEMFNAFVHLFREWYNELEI